MSNLEAEGCPLKSEFQRIGKAGNNMIAQLGAFASEVTRVAREVGTEGKLGGESRILEFKAEVNELLARAGEPPRCHNAESQDVMER